MARPRTGSVRFRAGRGWVARLAGEHLGYHKTEQEAWDTIAAALHHDSGRAPDTLKTYGAKWIVKREIQARARGKARAGKTEVSRWNTHIANADFAHKPLAKIAPKHVKQWVAELQQKCAKQTTYTGKLGKKVAINTETQRQLSRSTVSNALQLLKACFQEALTDGLISSNPAEPINLGRAKIEQHEGELVDHLSEGEIRRFFELPLPPRERAFFSIAIYGGLRLGEIHGLQWRDIDGKRIMVRRAYDKAVKTRGSVRDVPLLPPVAEAVREYRKSLTTAAIGTALLFPSDSGSCHGPSYTMGWADKFYRRRGELRMQSGLARQAGIINKTFHVLRHTCGCHLLQGTWRQWVGNIGMQDVSKWLGHTSISVTERHYADLGKDSLTNRVQRILSAKPSNDEVTQES